MARPKSGSRFHVVITSSRRPTRLMRTLMRDLHAVIPHSYRTNRGKMSKKDLAELASELGAPYVMLVNRWKGCPGKIEFYTVKNGRLQLLPPLIYVRAVRLQRQYPVVWRKLRIRPRELFAIQSVDDVVRQITEVLYIFWGADGWVEAPEEPVKGRIYFEVLPGEPKITFYSAVGGNIVEIGPAIKIRHLIWEIEKHGKGGGSN